MKKEIICAATSQIFLCSDISFNENWEIIDKRPEAVAALNCLTTGCDNCIKNLMRENDCDVVWRAQDWKFLKEYRENYVLIGRYDKDQDDNDCLILSCAPIKECYKKAVFTLNPL